MANVYIFNNQEGKLCVVHPSPGIAKEEVIRSSIPVKINKKGVLSEGVEFPRDVVVGEYIDRHLAESNNLSFKDISYQEIDITNLPSDHLFRQAWRLLDGAVVENKAVSLTIAHVIRRQVREVEFEPLDKQVTIFLSDPTKLSIIEAQRQVVRDKFAVIQQDLDECTSVDQLRAKVYQIYGV